jgi:hypothetical protein
VFIEVESNPNCENSLFARFKEHGLARPISQIRIYEHSPEGEWCWVTGWTDDPAEPRCQAYAQPVEDSGAGSAQLVFGGIWGIRLKPIRLDEAWNLDSQNQWGEAYLSLASTSDIRFADDRAHR